MGIEKIDSEDEEVSVVGPCPENVNEGYLGKETGTLTPEPVTSHSHPPRPISLLCMAPTKSKPPISTPKSETQHTSPNPPSQDTAP